MTNVYFLWCWSKIFEPALFRASVSFCSFGRVSWGQGTASQACRICFTCLWLQELPCQSSAKVTWSPDSPFNYDNLNEYAKIIRLVYVAVRPYGSAFWLWNVGCLHFSMDLCWPSAPARMYAFQLSSLEGAFPTFSIGCRNTASSYGLLAFVYNRHHLCFRCYTKDTAWYRHWTLLVSN